MTVPTNDPYRRYFETYGKIKIYIDANKINELIDRLERLKRGEIIEL